jgi:hypothetical protein
MIKDKKKKKVSSEGLSTKESSGVVSSKSIFLRRSPY